MWTTSQLQVLQLPAISHTSSALPCSICFPSFHSKLRRYRLYMTQWCGMKRMITSWFGSILATQPGIFFQPLLGDSKDVTHTSIFCIHTNPVGKWGTAPIVHIFALNLNKMPKKNQKVVIFQQIDASQTVWSPLLRYMVGGSQTRIMGIILSLHVSPMWLEWWFQVSPPQTTHPYNSNQCTPSSM